MQALSEELGHATAAMESQHAESEARAQATLTKLKELITAHGIATAHGTTLEAVQRDLQDQLSTESAKNEKLTRDIHELEKLRLQHQLAQDQNQSETLSHLEAKVTRLEAAAVEEQSAHAAMRRANADLKIKLESTSARATDLASVVASTGSDAQQELRSSRDKVHAVALENEELKLSVARTERLLAEAEGRESASASQATEASSKELLTASELQSTKDELQLQRSIVNQLNEQLAATAAEAAAHGGPDSQLSQLQADLTSLKTEHSVVQEELASETLASRELEAKVASLGREVAVGNEARKRLEEEARSGWGRADTEAGARKMAEDEMRAKVSEAEKQLDEQARLAKRSQSLLDTEVQRHEDAQVKIKAEVERAHAAELNAQHVATRARGASAVMRGNLIDIQSKYEKQLATLRVEKAKVEGGRTQAIEERQKLQEWVQEHMDATKDRLMNSAAAVQASETARAELEPQLAQSVAEARQLKDQLRRLARESASSQQQAAGQLENLQTASAAQQERLRAQLAEVSAELEEQRKMAAGERDRREVSERRVASELEAARLAELNASHAIEDAKLELGTAMQQAEIDISASHRQEIEKLRLEKAQLEGQFEHSEQEKLQLTAWIAMLEADKLQASGNGHGSKDADADAKTGGAVVRPVGAPVTSVSRRGDESPATVEIRKAQANLEALQERHALQLSEWRTTSRDTQIAETKAFAASRPPQSPTALGSPRPGVISRGLDLSPIRRHSDPTSPLAEGVPPLAMANASLEIAGGGEASFDAAVAEHAGAVQKNVQMAESFEKRL